MHAELGGVLTHLISELLLVQCEYCSKQFQGRPALSNLRQHVSAVHLGAKPYQCQQCQQWFSTKSNMKSHAKRRHQLYNI